METHPVLKRTFAVLFISIALAVGGYQFLHDIRMAMFLFLVAIFAGSLFAMVSFVTKEG